MEEFRIEEQIETDHIRMDDEFRLEYGREQEETAPNRFPLLVFDGKGYSLVSGEDAVRRCKDERRPLRYAFVVDLNDDNLSA